MITIWHALFVVCFDCRCWKKRWIHNTLPSRSDCICKSRKWSHIKQSQTNKSETKYEPYLRRNNSLFSPEALFANLESQCPVCWFHLVYPKEAYLLSFNSFSLTLFSTSFSILAFNSPYKKTITTPPRAMILYQ